MIILTHRGYWKNPEEKNSITAFRRSFELGFGTETDIRDYKGELVISHDIAGENAISVDEFFDIYNSYNKDLLLALNIKSDGLQSHLKTLLEKHKIKNYFVFDMSVPDTMGYIREGLKTFTRQSEFEIIPPLYEKCNGVWMDCFYSDWIDEKAINSHLTNNKSICIVSPDLHKREYKDVWKKYRSLVNGNGLFLCTDHPEEAQEFFNRDFLIKKGN